MSITNWFKELANPTPDGPETQRHIFDAVREFTTPDEPKVIDYPKGQYQAFWEIILGEVPGGHTAVVRFYGYNGSDIFEEHLFTGPTVKGLKPKVNELILTKMPTFSRS